MNNRMASRRITAVALLACAFTTFAHAAQDGDVELKQRAEAVKQSLAQSTQSLRSYEWIETTTLFLKDDEKSSTVKRCYYGADGGVQKLDQDEAPPSGRDRGIRGRIKERKKEELTDYMKEAITLIHQYAPPAPDQLKADVAAGKLAMAVLDPGKLIRLDFKDHIKPGDTLSIELDLTTNQINRLTVNTYLGEIPDAGKSPKDPINLTAAMARLNDGTMFTQTIELLAKSKDLKVNVTNSGYKKLTQ